MPSELIDSNIRGNRLQSALLIFGMVCLLSLMGFLIGNVVGLVIALVVCVLAIVVGPARITPDRASDVPGTADLAYGVARAV